MSAVAVDLPDGDLYDAVAHVRDTIEELSTSGARVVLVGHSYGGAVVTEAGTHPAVDQLCYLCAYALDAEETVLGITVEHEVHADIADAIVIRDNGTSVIDPERAPSVFYGDCSPIDVERALSLLRPQRGESLTEPPRAVAWRSKPTTYVVCGADGCVAPSLQRFMAERIPGAAVLEWPDSSHSPFLSRPGDVVDLLAGLAEDVPS